MVSSEILPPWSLQNSKNWLFFSHVEKKLPKKKIIFCAGPPPHSSPKWRKSARLMISSIYTMAFSRIFIPWNFATYQMHFLSKRNTQCVTHCDLTKNKMSKKFCQINMFKIQNGFLIFAKSWTLIQSEVSRCSPMPKSAGFRVQLKSNKV